VPDRPAPTPETYASGPFLIFALLTPTSQVQKTIEAGPMSRAHIGPPFLSDGPRCCAVLLRARTR
jgi:hypothetical protein